MPVKVEVSTVSAYYPPAVAGEILVGIRVENKTMADYIKTHYKLIGKGLCETKRKYIDLYVSPIGKIYGTSTVLPYRYFELSKSKEAK